MTSTYKGLLDTFINLNLSISEFLIALITYDQEFIADPYEGLVRELFDNAGSILLAFSQHPRSAKPSADWAAALSREVYKRDVQRLTEKASGFHFSASNARADQIRSFDMGNVISGMSMRAPHLWALMRILLASDGVIMDEGSDDNRAKVLDLVGFSKFVAGKHEIILLFI